MATDAEKKVPTLRERALSMVNDAFASGIVQRLPEQVGRLLATKDQTLPMDRTWVFEPGGLSIAVTFEWEDGFAGATMCAHFKVVDKGLLPNRRIFPDLLEGYHYDHHIRILPKRELETKVQYYYDLIRGQYEQLVRGDNHKLTVSSSINKIDGKFETHVSVKDPGWLRRRIVFVCSEKRNLSKYIDPFIDSSGVSTTAVKRCRTREGAENWIAKVTRALEKKNEEMKAAITNGNK